MLLEDLVSVNSWGEFRSDVQLRSFRRPENAFLASNYIFVSNAPSGKRSSVQLLRSLCDAFLPGNLPNRFVFIATYGHGKSHFALALANFFGRKRDSPELSALLNNLHHALSDDAFYGFFEDFKNNGKPFLIITISGDEAGDLPGKFFRGLGAAIADDPATQGRELPFWFSGALRFLDGIPDGLKQRADAFLKDRQLDLVLLRQMVSEKETRARVICRQLHNALYSSLPDFESEMSLRAAVEWAADEFCGENKPFEGLLILFDEFSAFVRDYAYGSAPRAGTPLQDLLNGVENRRGKAAFVAFSQVDLTDIVKSFVREGLQQDSLLKELERLPRAQRYFLHSSLEQVLDAYLKQDEHHWAELCRTERGFLSGVLQAGDLAFNAFSRRYQVDLQWRKDHFVDVVVNGCFPLHPLTTCLLATVDLQSSVNPRSVLGFVFKEVDDGKKTAAYSNGAISWVLPVSLVEHFRDMLGDECWRDYSEAIKQAGGPDASSDSRSVLAAMLLQVAGQIPSREVGFAKLIGALAGLSWESTSALLDELTDAGVIRRDTNQALYAFWPAGRTTKAVEDLLANKMQGAQLDDRVLAGINKLLVSEGLLARRPVSVGWGHQDDWQTAQVIVTRQALTEQYLRNMIKATLRWPIDFADRERGLIIWLAADRVEDIEWAEASLSQLLDAVLGKESWPVVVMVPPHPVPDLVDALMRVNALSLFRNSEILEVGQQQYDDVKQRDLEKLRTAWKDFETSCTWFTASSFRAGIIARRPRSPESLLRALYDLAYAEGPREFYTQYKASQTALRSAVSLVVSHLVDNSLDTPRLLEANKVASGLADQYLRDRWGAVTGSLLLKAPLRASQLFPGWAKLDEYFATGGGSRTTREALVVLLNPPYGYDFNTLSLLFATWLGQNRHDLEISDGGRRISVEALSDPNRKPRDFVAFLAQLSVARRDRTELDRKVRQLLKEFDQTTFSEADAQGAILSLSEFVSRDDSDPALVSEANRAIERLKSEVEHHIAYKEAVGKLIEAIRGEKQVSVLCRHLATVGKLPVVRRIEINTLTPEQVRTTVLGRIEEVTEQQCRQRQQLKDLTDYSLNRTYLVQTKQQLEKAGLSAPSRSIDAALAALDAQKSALEEKEKDRQTLAILEAIDAKGSLVRLRDGARKISALTPITSDVKERAAQRVAQIQQEIARLQDFVGGLSRKIDAVTDRMKLHRCREEIVRHQVFFDGAKEAAAINEALARCMNLLSFFSSVEDGRTGSLRDPDDLQSRLAAIACGIEQYGSHISGQQKAWAEGAVAELQARAKDEEEHAVAWFKQCERDSEAGERIGEIHERLKKPPAFLPEEWRDRLSAVNDEISARINKDQALSVEMQFRRIRDCQIRRECLQRLERIAAEMERDESNLRSGRAGA